MATEAASDHPTLFLALHCRVLLPLSETLSILKYDSLPTISGFPGTDQRYSRITTGFAFTTSQITFTFPPILTFRTLGDAILVMGLSIRDLEKKTLIFKNCNRVNT